jgi:hypothetical protein
MASRHCPKDRKIFHHRGAEAPRSEHKWAHLNSMGGRISTLSFTDFFLLIFSGLCASVVKILRSRHKIVISAEQQSLRPPNRGIHPIALGTIQRFHPLDYTHQCPEPEVRHTAAYCLASNFISRTVPVRLMPFEGPAKPLEARHRS